MEASDIRLISVSPTLIINSPTNPRRRRGLDIDSLNELADSIRAHGVMQPILVRPIPLDTMLLWNKQQAGQPDENRRPQYEIIAGERRWRGATLAELAAMPALVREDLSDDQVAEMQLVENIQRESLDPLEEADGFERLRSKHGYSIAQIAAKIAKGKGESYVYKRITLCNLVKEGRDAMYEEPPLDVSLALLVARYDFSQQLDVLDYLRGMKVRGEWPSVRTAKPALAEVFHLVLAHAPFDIADDQLVPAAGSCTACPKRSGNQGDIFGDSPEADSCTDTACFQGKREAHVVVLRKRLAKEGFKVIDQEEAMAATSGIKGHYRGFARLDAIAYTEEGKDGVERDVTFEDALRAMGKKAPKPRVIIDPHTLEPVKVITTELAEKLVPDEEPGVNPAKAAWDKAFPRAVDNRPEEQQALDNHNVQTAVLFRVFDAIRAGQRTEDELRLMAKVLIGEQEGTEAALRYMGFHSQDAYSDDYRDELFAWIDALLPEQLGQLLAMGCSELALGKFGGCSLPAAEQVQLAQRYGIDVLAVRDKVAEDLARGQDPQDDDEPGVDTSPLTVLTAEHLQPLIDKVQSAIAAEDIELAVSNKKSPKRKISLNELQYLIDAQAEIDGGRDHDEAVEELRHMVGLGDPAEGPSGDWATFIRDDLRALLKRLPQREEAAA